jgi:hypothetical protein
MEAGEQMSLEQIRAFVKGWEGIRFDWKSRDEVYEWVTQTLRQHAYEWLWRAAKGLIRAYIGK